MEEWDSKKMTSERKHAIYIRAFAVNLEDEWLRSPEYYHDKSQCLSLECISPAEMGIIKARKLKQGYIEPEELISQLLELNSSDNFTLRKYRHPSMKWGKSRIHEKSKVLTPPASEWFLAQLSHIGDMRRQWGRRSAERYEQEARERWCQVCNIELAPLPDLHLLKDMGRSPSGTLFSRYLVKGLHELRWRANGRGECHYNEEYERAKFRRREVIHRWQDDNPASVLADDSISIYRTWPSALMVQLDALDRETMRRGSERYMADLVEVEKKMQALVAFWKDCGLVTGQRTPPSPELPDPKAKLRGVPWPQYLKDKIKTCRIAFQ